MCDFLTNHFLTSHFEKKQVQNNASRPFRRFLEDFEKVQPNKLPEPMDHLLSTRNDSSFQTPLSPRLWVSFHAPLSWVTRPPPFPGAFHHVVRNLVDGLPQAGLVEEAEHLRVFRQVLGLRGRFPLRLWGLQFGLLGVRLEKTW